MVDDGPVTALQQAQALLARLGRSDRSEDDEEFIELPYTPSRPLPVVHGPVSYEAVLRPHDDQWIAEDHSAGCHVVAPTQEAAKQALAEALGDLALERAGLGMPIPKPAYLEEGWIVFTVSPVFRERPPSPDQDEQGPPTPAVEETPEAAPCRTVTLGPLLSRMVGRQRVVTRHQD